MNILVDSNILLRIAQTDHPMHSAAANAVDILVQQNHAMHIVPQNTYEFWAVTTRPKSDNGIGYSPRKAVAELEKLERLFILLPDAPTILAEWRKLVVAHDCKGKPSHDARIVAAMIVHGMERILTFNAADFTRYQGIAVIERQNVLDGKF